ncbi:MAG: glycosyltransferase family 2 protein [Ardenticatenales bacterium]|nr:glycosyltransferase family 2 protein [Ardenticatenales bacterium]
MPLAPVTVIIPAFNEAASISTVVSDLVGAALPFIAEIIVIDDGSSDETGRLAEIAGARLVRHRQNRGYGAALKSGIRAAQTEFVLTYDADGQHRPDQLAALWTAHEAADMVVGARQALLHSPLWRMPGKWLLNLMANYLMRRRIPDLNSGLRLMRREVISRYLHLCPNGFSFSTTSTLALLSRGYDVAFTPITVAPRAGRSTVSLRAGLDTIVLILRIAALFEPLRIFVPASLLSGLAGVLWGIPYALAGRGVSVGALLAIVTGILLFGLGILSDQISQLRLERYE